MILDNSEYVTKAICKPRASGDDPGGSHINIMATK